MSGAPSSAAVSQVKPTTARPSSSAAVPSAIGSGSAARNDPSAAGDSSQSSPSIGTPPDATRTRPGLGGVVGSACRR